MSIAPSSSPVKGESTRHCPSLPPTDSLCSVDRLDGEITYQAPTANYSPIENQFIDEAERTLTGSAVKIYTMLVRAADRKTGRCFRTLRQIATVTGIGYSTVRATVPVLVARGFITARKRYAFTGVDESGQDCFNQLPMEFSILPAAGWVLVEPKRRGRPAAAPAKNEQRLAEIKQTIANSQRTPAKNKQVKNKTHSSKLIAQNAQQQASPPAAVVGDSKESLPNDGNSMAESLRHELRTTGVSSKVAAELVKRYPHEQIRLQLSYLPARGAKNPAALLVDSIRGDWEAPREAMAAAPAPASVSVPARPATSDEAKLQAARVAFTVLPGGEQEFINADAAKAARSLEVTMWKWYHPQCVAALRKLSAATKT